MGLRRQLAKLTAPTLPALVSRPRLFKLLDQARRHKLVWIAAIPGSGKTSLVASYLRAKRQRSLWISLDEADTDPATFLHYLRLAAEAATPRVRTRLPTLTPEYLPELTVFAQRFFVALYQRLAPRTAIVFDNYQTLRPDSPVHELVRIATAHSPRGTTMFVMSRGGAPAVLAQLQVDQQMEVISERALRLTKVETAKLLGLHAAGRQRRQSAAEAKRLHAATGGWLAGTVLLLMHAGGADRAPLSASPKLLFDYFANEVLSELGDVSRKVLLATAFFPSMTTGMAQALTGEATAGRILASLHRAGYFTELHSETPSRYQYHPLFREFLLSHAITASAAPHLSAVQQQAAALLAADAQIEAAIALWIGTRRFDQAAGLVQAQAPLLLGQGRGSVVIDWVEAMPDAARDEAPWLWYWLGAAQLAVQPLDARSLLERALRGFERHGDRVGALLACATIVDAIAYGWRDVAQLDVWIERLAELAARAGNDVPPPIEAAVSCAMFYGLFWRRPGDHRFPAWIAKAQQVVESAAELDMRISAVGVALVNAYVNGGEIGKAERLLQTLEDRLGGRGSTPFADLACFQMRAVLAYTTGQPEASVRAATQGLEFAAVQGISFWSLPLLGARCLAELQLGDIAAAERSAAQMLAQSRGGAMVFRSWALVLQSWVAHERGNVRAAHRAAERALDLMVHEGPFPETLGRFSMAQTEHALGHKEAAALHLTRLVEIARDACCPMSEIGWRCMAAQFAFAAADVRTALAELRAALQLGAAIGYPIGNAAFAASTSPSCSRRRSKPASSPNTFASSFAAAGCWLRPRRPTSKRGRGQSRSTRSAASRWYATMSLSCSRARHKNGRSIC